MRTGVNKRVRDRKESEKSERNQIDGTGPNSSDDPKKCAVYFAILLTKLFCESIIQGKIHGDLQILANFQERT